MKQLTETAMLQVNGGSRATAIIGGAACALSFAWPIGTAIFGPTCVGMIVGTIAD